MKKKISRILGVGLTIALLASLMVAAPASAGTLEYTSEALPSATTFVINPVSLLDYAVAGDGSTIYAVAGTTHVYKSTNGGSTWSRVDLVGITAVTWEFVAVAPDDPKVVAVGDVGTSAVWISTNGAATGGADSWSTAGAITAGGLALVTFRDLAISPAVSGVRQVVAAGDKTGPLPAAFALNLGGTVASWTDTTAAGFGLGAVLGVAATTDIFAVAFSPTYISDRVMVAVSNDSAAGNFLNIARFTTATTGAWNMAAGFTDYTGAGPNNATINPLAVVITSASISLAPTYSGLDSTSRIAFVAINSGAVTTSGVFRMNDAVSKLISIAEQYSSVAFSGTDLVAGRSLDNVVYRSSDPLATTPTLTATVMAQRPSGGLGSLGALPTITRVAWVGTNVVAATLGNESAFSRSTDKGATFNDVSQIRTLITKIVDFAVAADGSMWYMVTNDGADVSVWSKTGAIWERLMSIVAPATLTYTIRIAPDKKEVVYLVNNGTTNIYYSDDSGNKSWAIRITNEAVADLAVESASILYYVSGLNVRKSTNAAFLWSDPSVPALAAAAPASIRSLAKDKLLVTSTAGVVAYSTDGGTTFTRLGALTGGGAILATAATLATRDYVYAVPGAGTTLAAATLGVYRYTIGSVAPDNIWTQISPATTATTVFTGLVLKGGILYAHADDPGAGGSTLWRTLNPTDAATTVVFTGLPAAATVATAPDFTIQGGRISNLQLSTTTAGNTIWGIDNDAAVSEEAGDSAAVINDEVYSLTDTVSTPPTSTAPAAEATIAMNPVSGASLAVTLSWNRPSLATAYLVVVAFDDKFTQPIVGPFAVVPADPAISPVSTVIGTGVLNPGTKYYWRVRATAPLLSPWSKTGTFSTTSVAGFLVTSPAIGATDVSIRPTLVWTTYPGSLNYEVMVATEPTFALIEFSHTATDTWYQVTEDETLDYSTIYYWRARGVTGAMPATGAAPPGSPWLNGVFTTEAEPVAPTPPVVIQPPVAPEIKVVQVPVEKVVPQAIPSYLLWTIIAIGAVLIIALIVLIVRTRRVA